MAREPKLDVVDLLRENWNNPNPELNDKPHKGIFPDYPRHDLKYSSYPRISVIDVNESGNYLGVGSNFEIRTADLEIGIWVKEAREGDEIFEIGGEKFANQKLVDRIKRDILEILREKWKDMGDRYVYYENIKIGEILYELERNAYVVMLGIRLVYLNDGGE